MINLIPIPIIEKYNKNYQTIPLVFKSNLDTTVWNFMYFNGAVSGLCKYKNEYCWFQCVDEHEIPNGIFSVDGVEEFDYIRNFVLIRLTCFQYIRLKYAQFMLNWFDTYINVSNILNKLHENDFIGKFDMD